MCRKLNYKNLICVDVSSVRKDLSGNIFNLFVFIFYLILKLSNSQNIFKEMKKTIFI